MNKSLSSFALGLIRHATQLRTTTCEAICRIAMTAVLYRLSPWVLLHNLHFRRRFHRLGVHPRTNIKIKHTKPIRAEPEHASHCLAFK